MLAQVMGHDFDYASPAGIFEELAKVSSIHADMSWDELRGSGEQWEIDR
jgi:predicted molibdopterin-dependent oxidoreductase YjgC